MTRKLSILVLVFLLSAGQALKADEGMWIPMLLKKYNIEDMQKKGFKLTAEDIYSINKTSMKDAVMIFGGGCTGELISDRGLLITNHHCGFGNIQSHSSVENDYLTDGFWAMSDKEELKNPGLSVTFLVRMEDVTSKVLEGITSETPEEERIKLIEQRIKTIKAESVKGTDYKAVLKPFFYGNSYYLFIEEVFTDIRLVGAPPSAIGKFGGDTDNWMWPRHTGDFSLFRIYANKDNKPAEYSEDNVPYKPKTHFPISLKGVKKGDFTMVFGYPGSTQEYLTSYAVKMITEIENPHQIKIRENKINIMSADMESSKKVRIQYASKYARVSNYWKKWIGENRGLKKLNAIQVKEQEEKLFTKWVNADESRKKEYGDVLPTFKKIYDKLAPYKLAEDYFFESIWGLESVKAARKLGKLTEKGNLDKSKEELLNYTKGYFKNYNDPTERKLFRKMIQMYYQGAGEKFLPDFYNFVKEMEVLGMTEDEAFDEFTDYFFKTSITTDPERFKNFVKNYDTSKSESLRNDPAVKLYSSFINLYVTELRPMTSSSQVKVDKLNRTYLKAQMEMKKDKTFYPDANFTLRVAYGQVDDYFPRDGVKYTYYTTLEGIMEKDNPDIYDYKVPAKLKELYKNKDYGQYAEDGEIHVCFTATNHTTGGNSGSPVINGNGELIGVNFDRCWEGTMSDIMFDPDQCRNITLDIRYALFIVDKLAGNTRLIDEMTLVK